MIDVALQWIGYAAVVLGYAFFRRYPAYGAGISLVGSVVLGIWAAIQDPVPWGVLALQVTCLGINLSHLRKEWS